MAHLLEEGFHFITHFDGTFFTTIKTLFTRPGQLSVDYCNGVRKKYFKPLSFFLLLVVLYLLFPFFNGLNMSLGFHMKHQLYGGYATQQVNNFLAARHISFTELAEQFQHKEEKTSKFLLFIIIPVMALFSWAVTFRRRPYYFDQVIFSTEAVSMLILWGFLLLPLFVAMLSPLLPAHIFSNELYLGSILGTGLAVYIAIATRRFFAFKRLQSILFTTSYIIVLFAFTQYIYKGILFFISIHLI